MKILIHLNTGSVGETEVQKSIFGVGNIYPGHDINMMKIP